MFEFVKNQYGKLGILSIVLGGITVAAPAGIATGIGALFTVVFGAGSVTGIYQDFSEIKEKFLEILKGLKRFLKEFKKANNDQLVELNEKIQQSSEQLVNLLAYVVESRESVMPQLQAILTNLQQKPLKLGDGENLLSELNTQLAQVIKSIEDGNSEAKNERELQSAERNLADEERKQQSAERNLADEERKQQSAERKFTEEERKLAQENRANEVSQWEKQESHRNETVIEQNQQQLFRDKQESDQQTIHKSVTELKHEFEEKIAKEEQDIAFNQSAHSLARVGYFKVSDNDKKSQPGSVQGVLQDSSQSNLTMKKRT